MRCLGAQVRPGPCPKQSFLLTFDPFWSGVENTQQFPRIEKEIFPEYKDSDLFLLDVTWMEDYIQELGMVSQCFSA